MAETEEKVNGTMNGDRSRTIDQIDPDDPEYQRQMMRPPVIEQDVKEMERRKRVEMIMNSLSFREELEKIIEQQMREGISPGFLDLILPQQNRYTGGSMLNSQSVMPIADIRGSEGMRFAKGEKLLRCKLAALYRLIDMNNWSQGIYNHISVRISQDTQHFLINPFGLLYSEITASSLLKVDMQGNVIDQGSTNLGFNVAGFVLHSSIHEGRPDIRCIIHLHIPSCIAVSACKEGLLPVSQESVISGEVSYHDYKGIIDADEKESIVRDLGPVNKVLILRNHGIVACGETIEEALHIVENIVASCESQVKLMPLGIENMVLISDAAKERVLESVKRGVNSKQIAVGTADEDKEQAEPKERQRKWKVGELEFEAKMRMLDNQGFRTGYVYKQPLIRSDMPRFKNDVEVPPASTSHSHMFDEDDLTKYSPLKKYFEGKRASDKNRWLNSPNVYQRVEVLETGTNDPKKITKWKEVFWLSNSEIRSLEQGFHWTLYFFGHNCPKYFFTRGGGGYSPSRPQIFFHNSMLIKELFLRNSRPLTTCFVKYVPSKEEILSPTCRTMDETLQNIKQKNFNKLINWQRSPNITP
ncbi:Protein hu-li tai shao [Nymphon striatum]|nr:Protein hu-li tai shao [Nymphon striatum]